MIHSESRMIHSMFNRPPSNEAIERREDYAIALANTPRGRAQVAGMGMAGGMLGSGVMSGLGYKTADQNKEAALDRIYQQFPNPQTAEEFRELGNALNAISEVDYAKQAFDNAKDLTTKDKARKTVKGDDGLLYYLDTGERVFPSQKPKPSTEGINIKSGWQLIEIDGALRMIPIPGGPADTDAKVVLSANLAKNESVIRSSSLVKTTVGKLRNLIKSSSTNDKYKSFDKKDETSDSLNPIFGITGAGASFVPGSNRKDAEELAATIKSHIGFDRLDRMRKESSTGGALGQVSEMELRQLNATLGSLEFAQSEEQFLYILDQIESEYNWIMEKIQTTGDGSFTQAPQPKDPFNIGL